MKAVSVENGWAMLGSVRLWRGSRRAGMCGISVSVGRDEARAPRS